MNDPTNETGGSSAPPVPPAGTRFMAVLRWGLVGGSALLATVMVLRATGVVEWSRTDGSGTLFHCPMHTTFVSGQPGECPICGMDLVPIESRKTDASASADRPAGRDAPEPPGPPGAAGAHEGTYTCPMHPEVVSDGRGECPKCGMDLVPASEASGHGHHAHAPTEPAASATIAIPGLAPIEVPLDRLELIGATSEEAVMATLDVARDYPAFIVPDEGRVVRVQMRFAGYIEDLRVRETGQSVRKGQVLFTVYSPEVFQTEQDFAVLRASGAGAEALSAARERLKLYGLPADEIRRLEQGGAPRAVVTIRASASGFVVEKNVFSGSTVQPNLVLLTIADLSRVFVLMDVPESDIPLIHVGDLVWLSPAADPEFRLEARVDFLYPALDPRTRTLRVRATLDNAGLRVRPGMFAKASLVWTAPEAVVIPWSAVLIEGRRHYVFVDKGEGRFEPREVRLGPRSGERVQVQEGVRAGERVVTSANFLIDAESRLQASLQSFGAGRSEGGQPPAAGHGAH